MELLLNACNKHGPAPFSHASGESEAKKWRRRTDREASNSEHTPDGMDDLQWEDEIEPEPLPEPVKVPTVDDEWSVLYRYYARIIEKTSHLLANAISMRDPHCMDAYQETPLHCAVMVGSYECMELLLKHKAPTNATLANGYTALHMAIEQPNLVELLLQYKANPNKLTFSDQMAPLHLATKFNAVDSV